MRRRWTPAATMLAAVLAAALPALVSEAEATQATQPPTTATGSSAALVRLPFPQDEGNLTPYTFEGGYGLVTLIYDTLLWRDDDGVPQPWLATSVEPSPDGRRVTVRLADGVRWHDGTRLTSTDVAFTVRFARERFHARFTPQLRAVERVDTPDETTAVFVLRHPAPGFVDQPLADVPILPAHLWQSLPPAKRAPDGLAVGSGPYRLVDHRPGQAYRFEANGEYFRGAPAVAALEVPVIRTAAESLEGLRRGKVDMLPVNLPKAEATRLRASGIRVIEGASYVGTMLMLNSRGPPFDRPEVRRAVSAALDLAHISRITGDSVPATRGFIHPESPWSAPQRLHTFDEAAARRGISGMTLLPLVVLAPDNDPSQLEAGRQVVSALRRVGMSAEMKAVSRDELSRRVGEEGSPPAFEAAIWTSAALASYDPDFLTTMFTSHPSDAPFNYSGYRSQQFDELAERIATTQDTTARKGAVTEALRLLATDAPVVPLFFATGAFAFRPSVYDGWRFVKGSGILDKRSFMEPGGPARSVESSPPPVPVRSERPWLSWVAGAAFAAAGVLGAVVVFRR